MKPNQDFLTLLNDHEGILQKVSRMYIAGYRLAGMPVGDAPLRIALERQITTLKRFRWISIFLRTAGLGIFFGFMMSHIPGLWEAPRLWLFGTALIWAIISIAINYGIWRRHFRKLEETLGELEE